MKHIAFTASLASSSFHRAHSLCRSPYQPVHHGHGHRVHVQVLPNYQLPSPRASLPALPTLTAISLISVLPLPAPLRNAPTSFLLSTLLSNLTLLPPSPIYSQIIQLTPAFISLQLLSSPPTEYPPSLLMAFLLGTVGTILGAFLCACLPLSLPQLPQLIAAFTATYVGGTLNFVAVANLLNIDQQLIAASMAVDLAAMAVYFSFLFYLSPTAPPPPPPPKSNISPTALTILFPLFIAAIIYLPVHFLTPYLPPGLDLAIITMFSFIISRITAIQPLLIHATPLANLLLNLFFAALGASCRFSKQLISTPGILVIATVILVSHAIVLLVGGRRIDTKHLLIASNANVGGASTAAAFAAAVGGSVTAAVGLGVLGYVLGTPVGIAVYHFVSFFKS